MIDFDITQISKDTKVVVFRVPFSDYIDGNIELLERNLKPVSDQLESIGVKALFIDDSISIEPITNDLMELNKFKSF